MSASNDKLKRTKGNLRKLYKEYKRERSKAKRKEYQREYQRTHKPSKEKIKAKNKKWQKENPEKSKEYSRNRRALKHNAIGKITTNEWIELCNKYENKCLCCGSTGKLVLDHIIPLIKGGTNTIDNAQPLCKSCNSKKNVKVIDYRALFNS